MPKLDRTGPMGQGSRTGRGFGSCGGKMKQGWGCHNGYSCGLRRCISPKNELVALEDQEKMLEEELRAIKEEKEALKNQ